MLFRGEFEGADTSKSLFDINARHVEKKMSDIIYGVLNFMRESEHVV